MNKKHFFTIMALAASLTATAQTMSVRMQDGKVIDYNLNAVEKVSFSDKTHPEPQVVTHSPSEKETINGVEYDISQYQSMELDDILNSYMEDATTANGKVFLLEGGKAYHLVENVNITKGVTIRTNPADVAKGLRAKLYLGGLAQEGNTVKCAQFMLGRQSESELDLSVTLDMDSIRFIDLDVDCPLALNYGDQQEGKGYASANYFMTTHTFPLSTNVNYLEWKNCTFQNLKRGFFRIQGSLTKNIHELKLTDCVFYNCGYYNANGADYGYIHTDPDSNTASNMLENVEISGNVLYDCPKSALISDNQRNIMPDENVRWNINIHHNTFVNYNTCYAKRLVALGSIPGGSTIQFHDNLIVLTKDEADINRTMVSDGFDVRYIQGGDGSGLATFVIGNNYSTNDNLTNGEVFATKAISSTGSNTVGKIYNTFNENTTINVSHYFPMGKEELVVKADDIKATELMTSPNPKNFIGETPTGKDHHTDTGIDGLYYQQTDKVRNSAIYKLKVGAPRLFRTK